MYNSLVLCSLLPVLATLATNSFPPICLQPFKNAVMYSSNEFFESLSIVPPFKYLYPLSSLCLLFILRTRMGGKVKDGCGVDPSLRILSSHGTRPNKTRLV